MHYLIYVSSASHLFSDEDLENILIASRRNNSESEVTGMLLYHEGMILQMLEGDKVTIQSLYEKIARDNRHRGAIKMAEGTQEARIFGEWTMGFRSLTDKDWSAFTGGLSLDPKNLLNSETAAGHPELWPLFRSFVKINERTI